jgi:hypothetical protein
LGVFAKRVVEDAQSQVKGAAEFGSAFHAGAEHVARTLEVDPSGPYAAWLKRHRDWYQANCNRMVWTERVLVNGELGYAGTADLLVEHQRHGLTLVDYKTQSFKKAEKAHLSPTPLHKRRGEPAAAGHRVYNSWCQQLAAYRRATGLAVACMNVIVNSTEPTELVEHLWSEEELLAGLESFEAALVIWRHEKRYDPRSWRTATELPQKETKDDRDGRDLRDRSIPVLVA